MAKGGRKALTAKEKAKRAQAKRVRERERYHAKKLADIAGAPSVAEEMLEASASHGMTIDADRRSVYARLVAVATVKASDYVGNDGRALELNELSNLALSGAQIIRKGSCIYAYPPNQKMQLEASRQLITVLQMKDIADMTAQLVAGKLSVAIAEIEKRRGLQLIENGETSELSRLDKSGEKYDEL